MEWVKKCVVCLKGTLGHGEKKRMKRTMWKEWKEKKGKEEKAGQKSNKRRNKFLLPFCSSLSLFLLILIPSYSYLYPSLIMMIGNNLIMFYYFASLLLSLCFQHAILSRTSSSPFSLQSTFSLDSSSLSKNALTMDRERMFRGMGGKKKKEVEKKYTERCVNWKKNRLVSDHCSMRQSFTILFSCFSSSVLKPLSLFSFSSSLSLSL